MGNNEAFPTKSTSELNAGLTNFRYDSSPLSTSIGNNSVRTDSLMSRSSSSIVGNAYNKSLNETPANDSTALGRVGNVDGRSHVDWNLNYGTGLPFTFSLTGNGAGVAPISNQLFGQTSVARAEGNFTSRYCP